MSYHQSARSTADQTTADHTLADQTTAAGADDELAVPPPVVRRRRNRSTDVAGQVALLASLPLAHHGGDTAS